MILAPGTKWLKGHERPNVNPREGYRTYNIPKVREIRCTMQRSTSECKWGWKTREGGEIVMVRRKKGKGGLNEREVEVKTNESI